MITQSYLKTVFEYDPKDGHLRWKKSNYSQKNIGKTAGCLKSSGYRQVRILGKSYYAHRLIWTMIKGYEPIGQIDHINGVRDDNRIQNLRECDALENARNQRKSIKNTSGFVGVSWSTVHQKWVAGIKVKGRAKNLGYFDIIIDAVAARMRANKEFMFHKNHGISCGSVKAAKAIEENNNETD